MPASQIPTAFLIDVAKVTDYLLNIDHPVGKPKAAFFLRCGFSAGRPEELANCLFAHAAPDNFAASIPTPFGTKWVFEGPIDAPAGVFAGIRSVWMVRRSRPVAELITAYRF